MALTMTGPEWATCEDVKQMAGFLATGSVCTLRKARLFAAACCRWPRVRRFLTDARSRESVEAGEAFADGAIGEAELANAHERARGVNLAADFLKRAAASAAWCCSAPNAWGRHPIPNLSSALWSIPRGAIECYPRKARVQGSRELAGLCRCVIGNSFDAVPFSPTWRTDTVLALARLMYDGREFSAMPILADALQDAGCDSDDILTHCRGGGPHARGCWVVDLVLGKE